LDYRHHTNNDKDELPKGPDARFSPFTIHPATVSESGAPRPVEKPRPFAGSEAVTFAPGQEPGSGPTMSMSPGRIDDRFVLAGNDAGLLQGDWRPWMLSKAIFNPSRYGRVLCDSVGHSRAVVGYDRGCGRADYRSDADFSVGLVAQTNG
jgi:hypothetical protein